MKIAFFEVKEWEKDFLQNQFHEADFLFFEETLSLETAVQAKDCQAISIFVDSQVNRKVIEKLPELQLITTRSTGFDHVYVEACKEKKITVCNVPFYGENTVAEHTFALILDISRKIHQSIEHVKKEGFSIHGITGFDLKGKTLGIIGLGHIGSHVARIARGFEMEVLVYDAKQDKKLAQQLGFQYAVLEKLLPESDIVTLHLPYNQDTHHIINKENIGLMKKGSYLINTARGGLIETEALSKALESGHLAGAGLDVLEEECFIKEEAALFSKELPKTCDIKTLLQNHLLMERDNVIITPHNAFNSKEALERILETTVENIKAFTNKKPVNLVS